MSASDDLRDPDRVLRSAFDALHGSIGMLDQLCLGPGVQREGSDSQGRRHLDARRIVHVTHEAVQKVGGIGAVLQGLITSSAYAAAIDRTILLGPLPDPHGSEPLGPDGTVVYDNWRGIWSAEVGPALYRIEVSRGVRIVYGRRRMGPGHCSPW